MQKEQNTVGWSSALALLRNIRLFAGLPEEQLNQLARMAVNRKVTKGTTIVYVGDHTDSLFIIVSGSARVINRDEEGREVILAMLAAGECFGEMGLIDGSPRSADVVTSEACELLVIGKNDFKAALSDNVDLCLNIMKSLVLRLRDANRKIESLALMDVYGRVAKLLLDLSEKKDGVRVIVRKVTKQDMAKMVGASREMVSRVMRDLEASGYIRVEQGRTVLTED
ncbi:MAG: cyclic nucleotide-binding domain-containing protein [Propionivibrio sp.]